jgi:vacuolar-type H+-ATPase subunit I/STV1
MAIDRMKKVWLVSPAADAASIPDQLARVGLLHVSEVAAPASRGPGEAGEAGAAAISRLSADTREAEGTIRRLTEIVDVLSEF